MKSATENMYDSITKRRRLVRSVFSVIKRNTSLREENNDLLSPRRSVFKSTSWGIWLRKASRQKQVAKQFELYYLYPFVFLSVFNK